ncbi:MAG: S8 family serine peptidase [Oscillospiraceae bacterium]|nr:S8 family serine peptidase [Oscillospiraceae bacterium]
MNKLRYILSAALMLFFISTSAAAADFIFKYKDDSPMLMSDDPGTGYLAPGIYTTDDEAMLKQLLRQGIIEYYEPNEFFYLIDDEIPDEEPSDEPGDITTRPQPGELPDDPYYINSQHDFEFRLMNANSVVNNNRLRGQGVKIGIIDTGIALNHEDIDYDRIVARFYVGANDNVEVSDAEDHVGHGTSVAGVVAARTNNGLGVASLAPEADIVIVKVFDDNGSTTASRIIAGLQCALEQGCDVINLSSGIFTKGNDEAAYSYTSPKLLTEMVSRLNEAGKILVAAAGNHTPSTSNAPDYVKDPDAYSPPMYPASLPEVISVASVSENGERSSFSYFNSTVDVAAPGGGVTLLDRLGGYRTANGTSFSAPYIASVAALAKQIDHSLTMSQFSELLALTSRDVGEPGWDKFYGHGIVDVAALLNYMITGGELSQQLIISDIERDFFTFKVTITNIGFTECELYSLWTSDYNNSYAKNVETLTLAPGESFESTFISFPPSNVSHMVWRRDNLEPLIPRQDISIE